VVGNWRLEIRDRDVAHGVATSPAAPGKDRRRAVTLLWRDLTILTIGVLCVLVV
jgi:hypothetical protein